MKNQNEPRVSLPIVINPHIRGNKVYAKEGLCPGVKDAQVKPETTVFKEDSKYLPVKSQAKKKSHGNLAKLSLPFLTHRPHHTYWPQISNDIME